MYIVVVAESAENTERPENIGLKKYWLTNSFQVLYFRFGFQVLDFRFRFHVLDIRF